MSGHVEVEADGLVFHPRFGFSPGMSYTVFIQESGAEEPIALPIAFPSRVEAVGTTRVLELYPTADVLPFNQLRLYIEFSSAMSEGQAAHCIHVIDEMSGTELADALLSMDPELWDRDRTRLTLLFDPGRIKQGLRPHAESGYPLIPGRPLRVLIDAEFADAAGQRLQAPFERHYEIGPDVRQHVEPSRWRIHAPQSGSADPLVVDFDRSLDFGLLQRTVRVRARDGARIEGRMAIGHAERSWAFVPAHPWSAGEYLLAVDHRLEDLAGNSLSRVFDRDMGRQDHDRRSEDETVLTFFVAD